MCSSYDRKTLCLLTVELKRSNDPSHVSSELNRDTQQCERRKGQEREHENTSHTLGTKQKRFREKKRVFYKERERERILTPLTPFFNLSSINKDKNSGDLWLRLMKYSKSEEII